MVETTSGKSVQNHGDLQLPYKSLKGDCDDVSDGKSIAHFAARKGYTEQLQQHLRSVLGNRPLVTNRAEYNGYLSLALKHISKLGK